MKFLIRNVWPIVAKNAKGFLILFLIIASFFIFTLAINENSKQHEIQAKAQAVQWATKHTNVTKEHISCEKGIHSAGYLYCTVGKEPESQVYPLRCHYEFGCEIHGR